jgi:hypothetical protein
MYAEIACTEKTLSAEEDKEEFCKIGYSNSLTIKSEQERYWILATLLGIYYDLGDYYQFKALLWRNEVREFFQKSSPIIRKEFQTTLQDMQKVIIREQEEKTWTEFDKKGPLLTYLMLERFILILETMNFNVKTSDMSVAT